ncbi:MAG: tetratricopeptide repeat protein [Anaerolineae bacterium]
MGLLDDKRSAKQQPDEELWEGLFGEEELETPVESTEVASGDKREHRSKRQKREKAPPKRKPPVVKAPKPKPSRAKGKGFTPGQLLILLLLAISIVVAYLVLASMIRETLATDRTANGGAIATPLPGVEVATGTPSRPIPFTPTPTPTRSIASIATLTPTPLPVVMTRFDQNIAMNPDDIQLRLQRGTEYLSLGAYTAALSDFEYAQTLDERRPETYIGIGWARYYLLDWPEAEDAFLTAISFNEDLPEPYFGIGMIYYLQGRYQEAAKEFDQAAERNPEFVEAEAWLAIAAARSGDSEEAMAAANRAFALTQDNAIVHIARSWAYRIQNPPNIDGAQGDLLYAQKLTPYSLELLIALAQFYTDDRPERIAEAEQLGHYAIQWAKNDLERARALQTLGHTYLAQGRKEDAQKVLKEAADLATYEGQVLLGSLVEDLNRALEP